MSSTQAPQRRTIRTDAGPVVFVEGSDITGDVHAMIASAFLARDWLAVAGALDYIAVWRFMRGDEIHELREVSRAHACDLPFTEEEIDQALDELVAEGRAEAFADPETGEEKFRFAPLGETL